jgi:hypothetical protein
MLIIVAIKKKIARFFIESRRSDGPRPISLLRSVISDSSPKNFVIFFESK